MNSVNVLKDALRITLKNKYLWIFGFIAGLTFSGGAIGINQVEGGAWFLQNISVQDLKDATAIFLGVISIIVWILGLIARGSLIQSVSVGVQSQKLVSRVTELSKSSVRFLGTLILMQILVWSPIIILNILLGIWFSPVFEGIEADGFPDFAAIQTLWWLGIGLFLLSIPFLFIDAFSYRSIVTENLGVIDSVKKAYYVIRTNVKPILGLSVLCVLLGMVFATLASFAAGILLFPLSLAMIPMVQQSISDCTGNSSDFETNRKCMELVSSQPLMVWAALLQGIIAAAIYSIWITFQSSAFTLAYVRLTKSE